MSTSTTYNKVQIIRNQVPQKPGKVKQVGNAKPYVTLENTVFIDHLLSPENGVFQEGDIVVCNDFSAIRIDKFNEQGKYATVQRGYMYGNKFVEVTA